MHICVLFRCWMLEQAGGATPRTEGLRPPSDGVPVHACDARRCGVQYLLNSYLYYYTRCKGSANRAKYKRKDHFLLYFRGAAYLRDVVTKVRLSERSTKEKLVFLISARLL